MVSEIITGRVKSGGLGERLMALFSSEHPDGSLLRGAAFAFVIRVASAGLALLSQALLARWIGAHEYGLFAYVYVWVIVLGTLSPLGMNSSILRFVPEYAEHKDYGKLRGILLTGGVVSFGSGTLLALAGAVGLLLFGDRIDHHYLVPFYLAFILLPMFSFTEYQEGVGRACSWIDLALIPPYIVRPVLLLGFMGIAVALGAAADVKSAFLAAIAAAWCVVGMQYLLLRRRLARDVRPEPRRYSVLTWFKVSLPLLLVEGFSLLLMNTDIMMMSRYLPPESVGHYYAAVKTTGLIGFVYYAVVAVTAQRISALNATGDKAALEALVRRSSHWTFWPSLAGAVGILSVGWPLLWMFGNDFTAVWPIMFILAAGLLVRAAVGPLDFVLNMMGQQNLCAGILGAGALINIGLNAIFIKHYGLYGAAAATSLSLSMISVMLLVAVDKRLGFHFLPWRRQRGAQARPVSGAGGDIAVQDVVLADEAAALKAPWRDLMQRCHAQNPVYGTDMILPALAHLEAESQHLRALCLWEQRAGKPQRLVGFIPYRVTSLLPVIGPRIHTAWHHQYGFCTLPLFDRERSKEAIAAWLNWVEQSGRPMRLPLALEGRLMALIRERAEARALSYVAKALYGRAVMRPDHDNPGYLSRALSRQRRKTLAKQWRQLTELGPARFEALAASDDPEAWIADFLELESRGWKGRAGTAMLSKASSDGFFQQMMRQAYAGGRLRFYRLMLDERPIAMTMAFDWGGQLYFFKMSYDEDYKRLSPGMLLFAEITNSLEGDPDIHLADSCSSPAHPLLNHMWTQRRQVCDVLIGGSRTEDRLVFNISLNLINSGAAFTEILKRVYHWAKAKLPR
ncbi:MAG: hypothetical protein C0605_11985 [Hyphomicrobiales bacterium]|nr:MAG: hypothetical protein C0605_11985 [Hyphomicrobiales bacterium]